MQTIIPMAIVLLKAFAETAVRGLHSLGAMLGITHNDAVAVQGDLDALVKADADSQTAKANLKAAQAAHDEQAEKAAVFLAVNRELLKPALGSRYSVLWNQAGFNNATLAVPRDPGARLAMVKSLEVFYETNPALETVGVATQVIAGALYESLAASIDALNAARVAQRDKKAARDAAMAAVAERLRALRRELKQFLGRNDSRWLEFGFAIPGSNTVPEPPNGLTATAGAVGSAVLNWARTISATRYRVFAQVVGVDADFVHVDTVTDLSKVITGLTPGAHVKFYVTAANSAGEGLPSETVELVVP